MSESCSLKTDVVYCISAWTRLDFGRSSSVMDKHGWLCYRTWSKCHADVRSNFRMRSFIAWVKWLNWSLRGEWWGIRSSWVRQMSFCCSNVRTPVDCGRWAVAGYMRSVLLNWSRSWVTCGPRRNDYFWSKWSSDPGYRNSMPRGSFPTCWQVLLLDLLIAARIIVIFIHLRVGS